MNSVYGEVPTRYVREYIGTLINKTYKILPLKEEKSATLGKYFDSYLRELVGWTMLFPGYGHEAKIVCVLSTITYLAKNECDYEKLRREVFKCIHILQDVQKSLKG